MALTLKEFTTSNRWWQFMWGGGHTLQTDPTKRGWRAALAQKGSQILIVGRQGVKGALSVRHLPGDYRLGIAEKVDVARYDDKTPEELADVIKAGGNLAEFSPIYRTVTMESGWVLDFIREVEHDAHRVARGWEFHCPRCGETHVAEFGLYIGQCMQELPNLPKSDRCPDCGDSDLDSGHCNCH